MCMRGRCFVHLYRQICTKIGVPYPLKTDPPTPPRHVSPLDPWNRGAENRCKIILCRTGQKDDIFPFCGNRERFFWTTRVVFRAFLNRKRTRKLAFRDAKKWDASIILPLFSHSCPIHASYSMRESVSYGKSNSWGNRNVHFVHRPPLLVCECIFELGIII